MGEVRGAPQEERLKHGPVVVPTLLLIKQADGELNNSIVPSLRGTLKHQAKSRQTIL
jgi:hypothetical protein